MKELSTNYTLRNGETKLITVKLEDDLADWLITQPEEVCKDFLIFEYRNNCVERKETRSTQSLNASLANGFDIVSLKNMIPILNAILWLGKSIPLKKTLST